MKALRCQDWEWRWRPPRSSLRCPHPGPPEQQDSGEAQAGAHKPSHESSHQPGPGHQGPVLRPSATQRPPRTRGSFRGQPRPRTGPSWSWRAPQIQRYRDPDTERLANAVELWAGKKSTVTTGSNTMLSQSLDTPSGGTRAWATLTPTE